MAMNIPMDPMFNNPAWTPLAPVSIPNQGAATGLPSLPPVPPLGSVPNAPQGGTSPQPSSFGGFGGLGTALSLGGLGYNLLPEATQNSIKSSLGDAFGFGEDSPTSVPSPTGLAGPPGNIANLWPAGLAPGALTAADLAFMSAAPSMGVLGGSTAPYLLSGADAGLGALGGLGGAGTTAGASAGSGFGLGSLGSFASAALPAAVAAFIGYKGLTQGSEDSQATQLAQAQSYGNTANTLRNQFMEGTWEPGPEGADTSMLQATLRQLLDGGYSMPFTTGGARTGNGIPNTVMAKPIPRNSEAYDRAATALLTSSRADIGDYNKYMQPEISGDGSGERAQYARDFAKYGHLMPQVKAPPPEAELQMAHQRYLYPEYSGGASEADLAMLRSMGMIGDPVEVGI